MKLTLRVYLRFNLIFFCSFIHQLKDPESLKSHVQELFPDQVKRKIVITYMLFAGWEVRIVKNCDLGLEDTAQFSKRTYLTIPGWRCCHRRRSGQVARPCEWARLAEMEAGTRKCEFHSYCLSRHEVTLSSLQASEADMGFTSREKWDLNSKGLVGVSSYWAFWLRKWNPFLVVWC